MPLRIVFMGTPEFAVPTLVEIVGRDHEVVAVYTRAPKPGGRRGLDPVPSPIEREARRFALPLFTPATLRTAEAVSAARAHAPTRAVTRGSLTPRWRGAAPINRAIMAGDPETGVMVMKMEEGLDSGPIAMAERVPIPFDATAGDLHDRLARLGADLMVRALAALERGSLTFMPQPEVGVTYAHKIANDQTRIAWERPWQEVHNHIRGLSPVPGAWSEIGGVRVKVLRTIRSDGRGVPGTVLDDELTVACGEGAVRIVELQRAGRQPMKAHEFLRGMPVAAGTRVG